MKGFRFRAISGCEGDGIAPSIYLLNIDGENLARAGIK